MQEYDAIFKIFGRAVFEASEVKELSRLNFEVTILKNSNFYLLALVKPKI